MKMSTKKDRQFDLGGLHIYEIKKSLHGHSNNIKSLSCEDFLFWTSENVDGAFHNQ